MNSLLQRLQTIHRDLNAEIRHELKQRVPDSLRLLQLKKLRLAVKDRLVANLNRQSAA